MHVTRHTDRHLRCLGSPVSDRITSKVRSQRCSRVHGEHQAGKRRHLRTPLSKWSSWILLEQRTQDGRQSSPDCQVIWLPKKSFAEAVICQQATKVPCQLVRSGNRYGIRVATEHAEQTHQIHRPEVVYLSGNAILQFRVGPLPFGSSKQSIANLFKKWGWQARPITPAGATRDKSGLQWIVQSTSNLDNWIYQTSTGDILITPESAPASTSLAKQAIIASDKTLQSLIRPDQKQPAQPMEDPWMHKDPWQQQSSSNMLPKQLQAMESNMEKCILQKIQENDKMDVDTAKRVATLEQQIGHLTQELATFQHSQGMHQQAVQQQINGIEAKVDSQHHALHQLIDTKLESQMTRIEQLFAKRPRPPE